MISGIFAILASFIFILFFSGIEKAFIKSDQLRLELDRKNGVPGSEIIRLFNQKPPLFIASMIIGRIISASVFIITFFSSNPVIRDMTGSGTFTLILNILIAAVIILSAWEFLPRLLFERSPNAYLKNLSVPALFFFLIFYPVAKFLLSLAEFVLSSFSHAKKYNPDDTVLSVDYATYPENTEDLSEHIPGNYQPNVSIFRNLLGLSELRLKEIMIPRTEIEAVPITGDVELLKERFIITRYSRILVYNETIDNVSGYFEVKDIFKNPSDIKTAVRKIAVVPETMAASRLLKLFVAEKKNIAVVVDEFGGTSGMVTIEDLLEEIVGNIEDEHDTNDLVEKTVRQNEFIFSGRLEIDYLNEKYALGLPESDDYATLAGLILFYNGSIPRNNDIIRIGKIVAKILRANITRIELVNIKIEQ